MTRPGLSLPNVVVYLQCSFPLLQNDLKHVSAEKHKLEKCATHVQSCSNAETLHDVIVNTDSGAANQKKSVMPLVID